MDLEPDSCYAAHIAREARFDGVFFTGVKSTGIYCRPVCPAGPPARRSCTFFPTAAAAEAAGFRACLRCRPELAPGLPAPSLAAALLQHLQERAVDGLTMAALEPELGLSSRHVQRLLVEAYGITPHQAMQTRRLELARQWLRGTDRSVSEIALAAGFRSLRAFHHAWRAQGGGPPSQGRRRGEGGSITLRLTYRPPLAWDALLTYLRSRLVPGVEEISEREYRRTVALGKWSGWVRVWPDPDHPALRAEVSSGLFPALGAVQVRLRRMFDLDARPDAIGAVLAGDPLTGPAWRSAPGLRVGGAWDVFELAVRAVLGQQISVAAATTLSGRLAAACGEEIRTPFPALHRLAITPAGVAGLTVDALCRLGMVSARATALLALTAAAGSGGLTFPPGTSHHAAVAQLTGIRGIGPWTAHYIAIRALRYPDAFPAADLGLCKAIGHGTAVTPREAETRSLAWQPWRAYAAVALWHSLTLT